ncbi:MAG: UDP-N-acetylmuramate dehydrogenase [Patescibacteria group bacterium]
MEIKNNVSLAPYTTFNIGGPARYFCYPRSFSELKEALVLAREKHLPIFVLGGGSNILVSDRGFDGIVIHLVDATAHLSPTVESENDENIVLGVTAGTNWDDLVLYAVRRNLYGIEYLSGVPGTVGGAVVANIGAYGRELSDVLVSVEVIDRRDNDFAKKVLMNSECAFTYHDSIFSREHERYIVLRATFLLGKHFTRSSKYTDNRFSVDDENTGKPSPTLAEVRERILSIREQKGALAMDGRERFLSAGSFFHMLTVSESQYTEIAARAQVLNPELEQRLRPWAWKQADGTHRVASAFLLEFTEFPKGFVRGSTGVSPKHQLSIINLGGARASEVAELAREMRSSVEKLFGVSLEREVEYVGEISC